MRALRVVGLHEDGKSIVCEDPARGERFLLPADERLRAAARGDVARLGQIEIETESQMRPREIQARIRAGESVEQVAAAAGIPAQRVERFAYPVLLERSRTADLAQHAHPVREDGPDVRTLSEVVAYAFGVRGQDYTQAEWDSWKGEDGKWVVVLRWRTGRSDNSAHWSFSPGAHGGTVATLDEHAEDLLDPNRVPRTLRAVEPETVEQPAPPAAPEPPPAEEPAAAATPAPEEPPAPAPKPAPKPKPKAKKAHPAVPAWEDVLLGVRSQRG
ncbi:MAG TPA: septation protein SepH [Amycolatopsis sp.]|uniref:septation protein SepH n=1 Tax=Amycolatopsis sp. TaxID=37632 RepID=UPI002B49846C|nr:septation protein SepH [Amycolatopsis sp.]HKS45204.1 septation protein SepH [Amycolatopsis sp.]